MAERQIPNPRPIVKLIGTFPRLALLAVTLIQLEPTSCTDSPNQLMLLLSIWHVIIIFLVLLAILLIALLRVSSTIQHNPEKYRLFCGPRYRTAAYIASEDEILVIAIVVILFLIVIVFFFSDWLREVTMPLSIHSLKLPTV